MVAMCSIYFYKVRINYVIFFSFVINIYGNEDKKIKKRLKFMLCYFVFSISTYKFTNKKCFAY